MAVEELLVYFLLIPAANYGVAAAIIRWGMRRGAAEHLGLLKERGALAKFLIYLNLHVAHILFGLVLYVPFATANPEGLADGVARSFGQTWGVAVTLTGLSQAWIVARRRAASFEGELFARVLILSVVPETVVIFNLVVGFQVVSAIAYPITPPIADGLTRASLYMMIGSIASPLEALLFNLTRDIRGKAFSQSLLRGLAAESVVVIALVLAFQELARVL